MAEAIMTYKKATAALDEAARARLQGPFLSGNAPSAGHEGVDVDDGLVELVHEFYNGYGEEKDAGAKEAKEPRQPPAAWADTLRAALADAAADVAAARIRDEAERAVLDAASGPNVAAGGDGVRKRVADRLRARGFDAGICRSSWERSGSVPAGSHEYVDVVLETELPWATPTSARYIVEVNIAAEFETARPSAQYRELLRSLPPVLVATPEAFKEVAAAMCAGAAESIRGAGMHLPPWRRARYVQAKWSGQYKRSVPVPAAAVAAPALGVARLEGASTTGLAVPAATRQRVSSRGPKHCGMEMAMGREGLVGARPLMFRGW